MIRFRLKCDPPDGELQEVLQHSDIQFDQLTHGRTFDVSLRMLPSTYLFLTMPDSEKNFIWYQY